MKDKDKKVKDPILTEEEENLLTKYLEEYNDIYPKILLLNPLEFFQNILKGLEISLKENINGFSQESKAKIEEYIIEKIYPSDYKFSSFVRKNIKNRNSSEISSHYFKGEILNHCSGDKFNDNYIHSCGEKFQYFRFKSPNNLCNSMLFKNNFSGNLNNDNNNDNCEATHDICLFCEKCEMIYKSNFIKFKCNLTGEDFYSKIVDLENNNTNIMQLATWKKYHCNAVMNDKMKCEKCNNDLYFINNTKVFCKTCDKEFNPLEIKNKCLICKNTFSSEAKIFNPLEYKALKICIKEAKISKIKAKPKSFGCGCNNDIKKIKFIHRKYCRGELFLGELNGKKVIICSKCDSICNYDNYTWTCPLCYKKFRDNETIINKDLINEEKSKNKSLSKERKINNNMIFKKQKTSIKSVLFKNLRHCNNKENINCNLNVINNKFEKEENNSINYNNNNSKVLKTIEKSSSGLSIHSRLFTEIDNNQIINLIERDGKNDLTNKKKRNMPIFSSKLINFTGNKRDSKIINNIPKCSNNILKLGKMDSTRESVEVKNLNNIFQKAIDKSCVKDRHLSNLDENKIIKKIQKAVSSNDIRKKCCENCLNTDFILNKKNYNRVNEFINNNNNKNVSPIANLKGKDYKEEKEIILNNNKHKGKNELISKIKRFNNSVEKDEKCEIIRVMKNIRQYRDIKRSRKKSVINREIIHIPDEDDNEPLKITKKLCKFKSKNDATKNIFEKDINKIKILKDFNVSDYKIIKKIGKGSFGQIFMVTDNINRKYALKKIIASSEKEIKSLKQEYQILFDIQTNLNENHTKLNVVNIYGLSSKQLDPTTYVMYVLMELGITDWEKEILNFQKKNNYYSEEELFKIMYDLVDTLAKLQKENISHRDIKPQNILVFMNNKNERYYKLADFGEAKELLAGNQPTEKQTLRGTELYMSPLLFYGLRSRKIKRYIKHNPYKSDVFSLGLCLLFAATLCFESLYDVRELKSNVSIKIIIEKYLKNRYSYKIINIISSMLDINETSRDDFIELKKRIDESFNK